MESNTTNPQQAALDLGLDQRRHKALTLKEAKSLPVQREGQYENVLYQTPHYEVRLSRMTRRDGARCNNEITVLEYSNATGGMIQKRSYQAK